MPERDPAPAASPALDETVAAPEPVLPARPAGSAAAAPVLAAPSHTMTSAGPAAAPAPGHSLATGMRRGHFQIDRTLGAGGMGEVYLATDLALDRQVAIKVLPAGVSSGVARDRLIREARAQARITHPNVAHIYFIGEQDGLLYFAMEYVAGRTLADVIARGPMPVEQALTAIHAAALGLREAHRAGFLHRDVKPSNLMFDAHGVVKVLDFGLVAGGAGGATDGPVEQTTRAGTPLYMAPEQARGEPLDLRADIYALGATLYHLVAGQPPFQADSADALVTLHATAARPAVPRGNNPRPAITAIDRLIARMIAPLPGDRFASYDELLQAIELSSAERTRPAGFLVRTVATGTDVALVALVLSLLAEATGVPLHVGPLTFVVAAIYTTIAIARWGRTLGKALLELEVVTVTGRRPPWTVAITRTGVLGAAPLAGAALTLVADVLDLPARDLGGIIAVSSVPILALLLLHASLQTPGKRAPWDRVAGTIVRYRRAPPRS